MRPGRLAVEMRVSIGRAGTPSSDANLAKQDELTVLVNNGGGRFVFSR